MPQSKRPYGTGSVQPYGEGRWRLRWRSNGAQRSKIVDARTSKQAEELLRAELVDVDQGLAVIPSALRVRDLMARWLDDEVALRVKPTTLEGYRRTVSVHVVPRLGTRRIQELTKGDIVAFRAQLARECGSRTAQQAFDRLTAALAWATEMEWLRRDVSAGVARPPHTDGEAHPLTAAECRRFLELARHDHYAPLWHLYLGTGLRRGEGLGLRWRDVNLDLGTVSVRQQVVLLGKPRQPVIQSVKSKASQRTIGIDGALVDALEDHRTAQLVHKKQAPHWFEHGLVFCTRHGTPHNPNNLYRHFTALMTEMGLEGRTPHDLRHSHATLLLMQGVPLLEVSARLGHANPQITAAVYSHWLPGSEERSLDALRGLMDGGLPELVG